MNRDTLYKANELVDEINRLKGMQIKLRPQFCNGVGICGSREVNERHTKYKYNLWSTHSSNKGANELVMEAGIKAMYDKVCELLSELENELSNL